MPPPVQVLPQRQLTFPFAAAPAVVKTKKKKELCAALHQVAITWPLAEVA